MSLRWAHSHFVGFVMSRLRYKQIESNCFSIKRRQTRRVPFRGLAVTIMRGHTKQLRHTSYKCSSPSWRVRAVVVVLVFYGPSTLFRLFWACSVNLSTLFLGKPHGTFASNWQLPFLNRRNGEKGCRNYFMTNLHERMLLDVRIEPAIVRIQGGRASDRATPPGSPSDKQNNIQNDFSFHECLLILRHVFTSFHFSEKIT